jgi:LacI family transcriptional regulator
MTMEKRDDLAIVTINNFYGARLATSHLVSQGRKNIGHISGPLDWWEARQRKSGWESALADAELNCSDKMWAEGNWSSKSGKTAFLELLEKYPQMDGLFVGNDQMALAVLSEAVRLGIQVPEDLAVVGFDGIEESEFFYPPLSTISQDQYKLGGLAVEELLDLMNQGSQAPSIAHKYIAVKPELVVRKSSQEG